MASSRKAAETGTAQVPRSCDGSVRAARPLITSPWATSSLCVFDLVRVDPNQWPFIFCEVRGKKIRSILARLSSIGIGWIQT
jgi:hypothetical protein